MVKNLSQPFLFCFITCVFNNRYTSNNILEKTPDSKDIHSEFVLKKCWPDNFSVFVTQHTARALFISPSYR